MSEHSIRAALSALSDPVQPSSEFRERLYEQLVADIDFSLGRPRRERRRSVAATSGRAQQIQILAALLALTMLAALAITGAINRARNVDPADLIRRSETAMVRSPAFDVTVAFEGSLIRYQYAPDRQLLRGQIERGSGRGRPLGGSFVFDGANYYEYDSDGSLLGIFTAATEHDARTDFGWWAPTRQDASTWPLAAYALGWPTLADGRPPMFRDCTRAAWVGATEILGHPADRVRCDDIGFRGEYWIDQRNLMLLRVAPSYELPAVAAAIDDSPGRGSFDVDVPRTAGGAAPMLSGALQPGVHGTTGFPVPLTVDLPAGWSVVRQSPMSEFLIGPGQEVIGWAAPLQVVDPGTGRTAAIPVSTAGGLVDWYRRHSPTAFGDARPTTFLGLDGMEVDIHLKPGTPCTADTSVCPIQSPATTWSSRLFVLDAGGRLVDLTYEGTSAPAMNRAREVLATIQFMDR